MLTSVAAGGAQPSPVLRVTIPSSFGSAADLCGCASWLGGRRRRPEAGSTRGRGGVRRRLVRGKEGSGSLVRCSFSDFSNMHTTYALVCSMSCTFSGPSVPQEEKKENQRGGKEGDPTGRPLHPRDPTSPAPGSSYGAFPRVFPRHRGPASLVLREGLGGDGVTLTRRGFFFSPPPPVSLAST